MSNSYQHEIPKARINITLDVETEGARKKKELPLKFLSVGDFSRGKTTGPVEQRERLTINKNNFDQVMGDLAPKLTYTVEDRIRKDGSEMQVNFNFDAMKKFSPVEVVNQVPELQNLLAMRNLLKDLKSNLMDNTRFRRELEGIAKQRKCLDALRQELSQKAPLQTELKGENHAD